MAAVALMAMAATQPPIKSFVQDSRQRGERGGKIPERGNSPHPPST